MEELIGFGTFHIETRIGSDFPCDVHFRRSVEGPARLFLEERVKHRFELILHPRSLKDAGCFVRTFVEKRIAQNDSDLIRKHASDFFDDRMLSAAGLAGRVEEFDQRDRRIFWAKAGRVGSDKKCRVHGRGRCGDRFGFGLTLAVQEKSAAPEGRKPEG